MMGKVLKKLLKIGALFGAIAAVVKGIKFYQGSPEGVGSEGFDFDAGGDDDDPYAVDESSLGGEVSQELLDRLVCPLDKGPLDLSDGRWLINPRNGYRYPITDGIPVMLIEVGERYRDPAHASGDSLPAAGDAAEA